MDWRSSHRKFLAAKQGIMPSEEHAIKHRIKLDDGNSLASIDSGGIGATFRFGTNLSISSFMLNAQYEQEYLVDPIQTVSWGVGIAMLF